MVFSALQVSTLWSSPWRGVRLSTDLVMLPTLWLMWADDPMKLSASHQVMMGSGLRSHDDKCYDPFKFLTWTLLPRTPPCTPCRQRAAPRCWWCWRPPGGRSCLSWGSWSVGQRCCCSGTHKWALLLTQRLTRCHKSQAEWRRSFYFTSIFPMGCDWFVTSCAAFLLYSSPAAAHNSRSHLMCFIVREMFHQIEISSH